MTRRSGMPGSCDAGGSTGRNQPDGLNYQLPFPLPRLPFSVPAGRYWQAAAARPGRAHPPLCRADHLRLPDGRGSKLSRVAKRAPAYPCAQPEDLPLFRLCHGRAVRRHAAAARLSEARPLRRTAWRAGQPRDQPALLPRRAGEVAGRNPPVPKKGEGTP